MVCTVTAQICPQVNVAPGSSLVISGSWFHQGVVYVRFDGFNVVGTVTGNEWRNAQIIGTTTASSTGSFSTTVTIPSASGGQHFLAVEDSQTRLIAIINVNAQVIEPTPTPTPTASPVATPTPTPNPSLPTPSIGLSCKSDSIGRSFKVEITGELTLNGIAVVDQPVFISYSVTGGKEWKSLTLVRTLSNGGFSAVWIPDVTGDYLVKATVEATSTMNAATKTVNLAITPAENNVFTINSNSTIRQFNFDPESKELSFTVEGSTGTTGYVDIFIPKAILSNISELKAFIDGKEISFNNQSLSDSWLISFTYFHSQHVVTLTIGNAVQPNGQITDETSNRQLPLYIAILATVMAVTIAVVALKRKSKHNPRSSV